MIVNVPPCANVTLFTVITWPDTPTVPELDVVQPGSPFVIEGADQFAGTVNSTAPAFVPPAAVSVYVTVSVLFDVPATAEVGAIDAVPDPSAAFVTLTDGDEPNAVNVPALVDFSRTLHVALPDCAFDGVDAPVDELHAPVVAPYVIVNVALCANVTLLTVIT